MGGKIVVHARLQSDCRRNNDDPKDRPTAKCIYLFEDAVVLTSPMGVAQLPQEWQKSWLEAIVRKRRVPIARSAIAGGQSDARRRLDEPGVRSCERQLRVDLRV
jgi:hypothetical protein